MLNFPWLPHYSEENKLQRSLWNIYKIGFTFAEAYNFKLQKSSAAIKRQNKLNHAMKIKSAEKETSFIQS